MRTTRGPLLGASQNLGLHSAGREVIVLTADDKTMEESLTDAAADMRYLRGTFPLLNTGRYVASVASATRGGGSVGDSSLRSEIALTGRHCEKWSGGGAAGVRVALPTVAQRKYPQ